MRGLQNYQKCHLFVFFKLIIHITVVFMDFFLGFYTNLAGNLHFRYLILAGGHLFLKILQLASQKWLPKSKIGWELVPIVPTFLEPCYTLHTAQGLGRA